jgi:hypothetical protein
VITNLDLQERVREWSLREDVAEPGERLQKGLTNTEVAESTSYRTQSNQTRSSAHTNALEGCSASSEGPKVAGERH